MAAKEEATGGDVASAEVTTLDLTRTAQIISGSVEWTTPTSGGVYLANNLTRPGAMGACMFPTSVRVIMTHAKFRRFNKAQNIIGRS